MDYGLPIYGWCTNTNIKLLESPYHAAIRRSINAFPTSPIKCILGESGLPSIKERVYETTIQLLPKLLNSTNADFYKTSINAARHKRNYRIKSTLRRCLWYGKTLNIHLSSKSNKINIQPEWLINEVDIDTFLHRFKKLHTNNAIFQQYFAEIANTYKCKNFTVIYTDGSKATNTAFAVTTSNGTVIAGGILPPYASVFTAEAFAIHKALEYATSQKGKFVICSDSYSCFNAIHNIRNTSALISKIRDLCIKYKQKIALLWVPGHVGIVGNEHADNAAKYFESAPTFLNEVHDQNDVRKMLHRCVQEKRLADWRKFEHRYTNFNPLRNKILYPSNISRLQATIFTRLRIGHTQITHQHLLTGNPRPLCPFCPIPLTVDHILRTCPALESIRLKHFTPSQYQILLKSPSYVNIISIYNFLVECKLHDKI